MIIYEEVFNDFQKQNVKYLIVGGIAFNLHGSLRNTADLDILLEMSNENLAKVVEILTHRGYRVRQPVDPMKIADEKIRKDWIQHKHMKAFNFYKDKELKEVDIIIDSPVSFEQAKKRANRIQIGNLTLPFISINDLIKMKQVTGRTKDKEDIVELKRIKKLKGKI